MIKFLSDFKTYVDHDSFFADCVHPLAQKLDSEDMKSTAKLCLGLYQLTQGLEFLHEKVSHNDFSLSVLSIIIFSIHLGKN